MESTESLDLDFQKLWLILKRRWLPATGVFSLIIGLTVVAVCLLKPDYEAEGKLLIKKADQTSALTGLGQGIGDLEGLNLQSNPVNTEIEVVRSIPLLQKTIAELNLKDEKDATEPLKPEDLQKRLKLKNIGGTDVLQLSYKSHDAKEAAAVINKLMSLYIDNNIYTNRVTAVAAGDFIAKQLPETEVTVRKAEAAVRQFKEQNHIVNLEEEGKAAIVVIQNLESQITQTRAALADANSKSAMLQKQVGMSSQNGMAVNTLNQSPGVQQVLGELQKVEGEIAILRTKFLETHPNVVTLKNKRDALKSLLQQRVGQAVSSQMQVSTGNLQIGESRQRLTEEYVKSEADRLGLASQLASLLKNQSAYKQQLNIAPKLEQQQRELERRLKVAQSTYEILLQKLQEVRVAENQNMGNARVIESALVPDKALLFKPAIAVALGGMLSLLMFGTTIVILEARDKSLKTLKDARDLFGYTFLGAIPCMTKKASPGVKNTELLESQLPVRDTPRAPIAEAFRMLQANLKFLSSEQPKVIVVTSSVPGEGKSTVSANLSAAIAQLEHRVLLVDADMRRPRQHHIWEKTNAEGLSDVIVGQAEFKSTVTEVMNKLQVLTAGANPPNPVALLESKGMATLIEDASQAYDFVIIDAPPVLVAADALNLGKLADGVLMVARPGVVNTTTAAAAKDLLVTSAQNVLGLVVNGVILENESDSYFYYVKEYYIEMDSTTSKQTTTNSKVVKPRR